MNIRIVIGTSRDDLFVDLDRTLIDNLSSEEQYSFFFSINLYDAKKKVAEIKGSAYNEDINQDSEFDLAFMADDLHPDAGNAIYSLLDSKMYHKKNCKIVGDTTYICYLSTFYVYPQYRKRGIAKYLFNNLNDIMKYMLNFNARYYVIIPKPQIPTEEKWIDNPDEDGKMKELMVHVIERAGFKRIDSEVWVKYNKPRRKENE